MKSRIESECGQIALACAVLIAHVCGIAAMECTNGQHVINGVCTSPMILATVPGGITDVCRSAERALLSARATYDIPPTSAIDFVWSAYLRAPMAVVWADQMWHLEASNGTTAANPRTAHGLRLQMWEDDGIYHGEWSYPRPIERAVRVRAKGEGRWQMRVVNWGGESVSVRNDHVMTFECPEPMTYHYYEMRCVCAPPRRFTESGECVVPAACNEDSCTKAQAITIAPPSFILDTPMYSVTLTPAALPSNHFLEINLGRVRAPSMSLGNTRTPWLDASFWLVERQSGSVVQFWHSTTAAEQKCSPFDPLWSPLPFDVEEGGEYAVLIYNQAPTAAQEFRGFQVNLMCSDTQAFALGCDGVYYCRCPDGKPLSNGKCGNGYAMPLICADTFLRGSPSIVALVLLVSLVAVAFVGVASIASTTPRPSPTLDSPDLKHLVGACLDGEYACSAWDGHAPPVVEKMTECGIFVEILSKHGDLWPMPAQQFATAV